MVAEYQQRHNSRAFWTGTEYGGAYWTSITEVGERKFMNLSKTDFLDALYLSGCVSKVCLCRLQWRVGLHLVV